MSKIQMIIYLLIVLILLFSMDMIFGNSLRESFGGGGGRGGGGLGGGGLGGGGLGVRLGGGGLGGGGLGGRGVAIRQNILNNDNNIDYNEDSDDQPLYFSFPFFKFIRNN
jgi:hypothetical protein